MAEGEKKPAPKATSSSAVSESTERQPFERRDFLRLAGLLSLSGALGPFFGIVERAPQQKQDFPEPPPFSEEVAKEVEGQLPREMFKVEESKDGFAVARFREEGVEVVRHTQGVKRLVTAILTSAKDDVLVGLKFYGIPHQDDDYVYLVGVRPRGLRELVLQTALKHRVPTQQVSKQAYQEPEPVGQRVFSRNWLAVHENPFQISGREGPENVFVLGNQEGLGLLRNGLRLAQQIHHELPTSTSVVNIAADGEEYSFNLEKFNRSPPLPSEGDDQLRV